jgi:hypothetical protein
MAHSWNFFRAGGVDQVRLESSDDLRNLASLDQKLWVALACPVGGLQADPTTLKLLDRDGDGRVRAPDVVHAVESMCAVAVEPSEILGKPKGLPLARIRGDSAQGKAVLASARIVLAGLGKPTAAEITPADVSDQAAIFANMPLNGDGVVPAFATTDPVVASLIVDTIATVGGVADRSGKDGVNIAKIDAFFAACEAFAAWTAATTTVPGLDAGASAATSAAIGAVRAKIDDFFARVRLAGFDARGTAALNGAEALYTELAGKTLAGAETEGLPLAHIAPGAALPLTTGVNPAWSGRIDALRAVLPGVIGARDALTEADWSATKASVAAYDAWVGAKAGSEVEKLGIDRASAVLAGGKAQILALIAQDEEHRAEAEAITEVARIVHLYCHLGQILKNFVNFSDFYGRTEKAIFQAGTVYLDRRTCDLVVEVQDGGRHGSMAGLAGVYLAYLDCTRKSDGKKISVCAAVTDGDSDNLMVGRNGLFYDRKGNDYDATITKIIDNPISIRQAFWSPYKKFLRAVEDFIAKRAAAADAESSSSLTGAAEKVANADKAAAPAAPAKFDVGVVAALGVAVGGITAALGAILDAVFGLGYLMPLGLLAMVLFISGPSMLIAALKLRRRNLGPLLDADGWALNAQTLVNIPFGRSLTQLATLPPGSSRDLRDPYEQKKSKGPAFIAFLVVIGVIVAALCANPDLIQGWVEMLQPPPPAAAPADAAAAPAPPA